MRAVMTCNAHLVIHPFLGFSMHPGFFPPYVVVNPQTPSLDGSLLGGFFLGSLPTLKITDPTAPSILGPLNQPLIGRNSDAGFIIPHVHLGLQFDWLQILSTLLGSSKNLMGARSVQVRTYDLFFGEDESAIGTCLFPGPVSLNLACYGAPFPMLSDVVVAPNTIRVGVTLLDIIIAFAMLLMEMAIAIVMNKASSGKWMGSKNLKAGSRGGVVLRTGGWYKSKLLAKSITKAVGKAGAKFGKRSGRAELNEDVEEVIIEAVGLDKLIERADEWMAPEESSSSGTGSSRADNGRSDTGRAADGLGSASSGSKPSPFEQEVTELNDVLADASPEEFEAALKDMACDLFSEERVTPHWDAAKELLKDALGQQPQAGSGGAWKVAVAE